MLVSGRVNDDQKPSSWIPPSPSSNGPLPHSDSQWPGQEPPTLERWIPGYVLFQVRFGKNWCKGHTVCTNSGQISWCGGHFSACQTAIRIFVHQQDCHLKVSFSFAGFSGMKLFKNLQPNLSQLEQTSIVAWRKGIKLDSLQGWASTIYT